MQHLLALLALVAAVTAQTSSPPSPTASGYADSPSNCAKNWKGTFEIATQNYTDTPATTSSAPSSTPTPHKFTGPVNLPSCDTKPIIQLNNGTLTDQDGRIAEVLEKNGQFQFDAPLQDGRLYATGFEVCVDPSGAFLLAHGAGNTTFFQGQSGDFSNLYGFQFEPYYYQIYLQVLACPDSSPDFSGSTSSPTSISLGSSSASSTSSSTPSSSPAATSMVSSTSASPSEAATTAASAPVISAAPYPTGNITTPVASGTGSPSSTAPGSSTSSPATAPASGAQVLTASAQVGALAAALVAFAML